METANIYPENPQLSRIYTTSKCEHKVEIYYLIQNTKESIRNLPRAVARCFHECTFPTPLEL